MIHVRRAALASAATLLFAGAPSGAVPAAAPRPFAWLTPDLIAQADAAGPAGVTLPARAYDDVDATSLTFTGIRPGTMLSNAATEVGTANFVFQTTAGAFDPTQQLYVGTVGHGFSLGETVYAIVAVPRAGRNILIPIGTVVLQSHTLDTYDDFALVEIDPARNDWVSPSMTYWGGPTGVYTGGTGGVVSFVGNAEGVGGVAPRVGQLTTFTSTDIEVRTALARGDSGAPVTTLDGLAVGHLNGITREVLGTRGTSITAWLDFADKPLATCPTRTPWPLPGCPAV